VLSLIDDEGFPTTSVITPSKSDGINWITFGTLLDDNRAKRSLNCNRASVCFATAEHCVNLVGEIEVITSSDIKHEMWYDALKDFFTGPDDPNYCVLKFKTKRYKFFINGQDVEGKLT
jgi:general stress protein 26